MKRFLKITLAPVCLAVITVALLQIDGPAPQLPGFAHEAVISGDSATVYVMPSRFSASTGVCLAGERLTGLKPSLFGFYRARCNNKDGWISHNQIMVMD